jgi:hypothetical protein
MSILDPLLRATLLGLSYTVYNQKLAESVPAMLSVGYRAILQILGQFGGKLGEVRAGERP